MLASFEKKFNQQNNTILITPNKLLEDHLNLKSCNIAFSPEAWLQSLLPKNCKTILNKNQETILWQEIISRDNNLTPLSNIHRITDLAQEAWAYIQNSKIPIDKSYFDSNENTLLFQNWAKKFTDICDQNNFIDQNRLSHFLSHAISQQSVSLPPQHLFLTGFDQIPPAFADLLTILKADGWQISELNPQNLAPHQRRISCSDTKQEILTMARWALARLKEKPDSHIGCIVPKLPLYFSIIERTFREIFSDTNFNIFLSKPLLSFPAIDAAIKILELNINKPIDLKNWLELLSNPFLGDEKEIMSRATAEIKLRELNKTHLTLAEIIKNLNPNLVLTAQLKRYASALHDHQSTNLPSYYKELFSSLLKILWQEKAIHPSLLQQWQNVLQELAEQDLVSKDLNYEEALARLKKIAARTSFQPEQNEASISILKIPEALGFNFGSLWVMGMDNENWPERASPNPFIPLMLQKKFNLPHSSLQQEINSARNLNSLLAQSTNAIIYSHINQVEERKISVSPLLTDIDSISHEDLKLPEFTPRWLRIYTHYSSRCEKLIDPSSSSGDEARPQPSSGVYTEVHEQRGKTATKSQLEMRRVYQSRKQSLTTPDEKEKVAVKPHEKIRGGSRIFQLQALCPFRAFAEFRLNAKELNTPQIGFNKMERGTLIHDTLYNIWHVLKTWQRLTESHEIELKKLIADSIDKSITKNYQDHDPINLHFEKKCLQNLLWRWLQYEKTRSPFTVEAMEKTILVKIGAIEVKLRIDRIDRLPKGDLVIIDYKTGKNIPNINDWFTERPNEPQMPLYCIASPEPVSGLVFAKVDLLNPNMVGLEKIDNWQELSDNWYKTLEKLAYDFQTGHAAVDPKDQQKTCNICDLKILCRKH